MSCVLPAGASAIQIIPAIQPLVQSLTVFQRTPPWVMSRKARMPGWAKEAASASAWYNRLQRCRWFGGMELLLGNALTRNKQRILAQVRVARVLLCVVMAQPTVTMLKKWGCCTW
jgi:cation diffusion facilitator CzcD-associated flavoprotein CzcO